MADNRVRYNALAREQIEALTTAFENSINNFTNEIDFNALVEAIRADDTQAINAITNMDVDNFDEVAAVIAVGFIAGGALAFSTIPRGQKNPNGTPANREFSGGKQSERRAISAMVTSLVSSVNPSTRRAVRATIQTGKRAGKAATTIARDLVGVSNPATGVRQGGVIGLSGRDAKTLMSVNDGFINGDKARISSYFNLKNRDSSLDKRLRVVIDEGGDVGNDLLMEVRAGLRNNFLFARATLTSDLEARNSIDGGRKAGYQRIMDNGLVERGPTKIWRTFLDGQTRQSHRNVNGDEVGIDENFTVGGETLPAPRDSSLGASAGNIINCRCYSEVNLTYKDNG